MKYYLIVGEASGDLHASHLMSCLKEKDPQAEFRFFGGPLMAAVGGTCVKNYKELAYMGFGPVLLHLRTILSNMRKCKRDIISWCPDVLILVDYPSFNLNIAKYIHSSSDIPVFYYISPKIWAWKEYRIKQIKRDIDELFCILPFETDYYLNKHSLKVSYVGSPTLDEVQSFLLDYKETSEQFCQRNGLSSKPIISLLAGSRKQEIKDNLPSMLSAAESFQDFQVVVAGAPGIEPDFYEKYLVHTGATVVFNQTYPLLAHTHAALVTSGTATLETALFNVPQAVCYYTPLSRVIGWLKKMVLSVRFVSLVNLITDTEVVKELVADKMTLQNIAAELGRLVKDTAYRQKMQDGYDRMRSILGETGASERAAQWMIGKLNASKNR